MPERHGYKIDGGWASGTDNINGNSIPQQITADSRTDNTPAEYKASNFIEFVDGFVSGASDEFFAYIATASNIAAGNTIGSGGEFNVYRYGFNGKENDREFNSDNYDFGARIYDGRLGRLLSIDQKFALYPAHSPYCYAVGNPIYFIDPDGNSVEPSNVSVTKVKGTSKFIVTGDITIKIQVLNLSAKANNDLYIHDYVNRVKSGLTDLLNTSSTVMQTNDIDLQVGGKGTASNKLVKTGKMRKTEWTYAFNVNVQIEVIDSKDKIRHDAHVFFEAMSCQQNLKLYSQHRLLSSLVQRQGTMR